MTDDTLKPDSYIPRIADRSLSVLLSQFGGVEVAGAMWCGKTWTSLSCGKTIARIGSRAERIAAEADPSAALVGNVPHVIDEWQDVPAIWDEVRHAIDLSGGKPGQFILTGSSRPKDDAVSHSGAGRIARLKMHPMTLSESGESAGNISLSGLFDGLFTPARIGQKLEPLAHMICRGGWPAMIQQNRPYTPGFLDNYFDAVFDVSIPKQRLSGSESRRVAESLARNMGSAIRLATVANDAGFTEIDQKSANTKVASHIAALERLYMIDVLSGWDAPIRSKTRLRIKPKYYFADPSLPAALMGITPDRLLKDGNLFGVLFEALCIRDLMVYASALPHAKSAPLSYYRDADGLETDVIIELRDGRWAAIEIKLGENKLDEAAHALHRLKKKIAMNPAARNPAPAFLAVIVGAGESARFDTSRGVYVIPVTSLTA